MSRTWGRSPPRSQKYWDQRRKQAEARWQAARKPNAAGGSSSVALARHYNPWERPEKGAHRQTVLGGAFEMNRRRH